jgi:hypothetical protein
MSGFPGFAINNAEFSGSKLADLIEAKIGVKTRNIQLNVFRFRDKIHQCQNWLNQAGGR